MDGLLNEIKIRKVDAGGVGRQMNKQNLHRVLRHLRPINC